MWTLIYDIYINKYHKYYIVSTIQASFCWDAQKQSMGTRSRAFQVHLRKGCLVMLHKSVKEYTESSY